MPAPSPEIDRLGALAAPIVGPIRSMERLASGTSGTSYLIATGSGRYVAKLFAPNAQVLLGPAAQFRLLEALAGTGLAPVPAGFDAGAGLLITRYLEGASPLARRELVRAETLRAVAAALRSLHTVHADIPAFAPRRYLERYAARIGGYDVLTEKDRARFDELVEIAGWLEAWPRCLCHNDLAIGNLLYDGSLRLVDFDYAVIAPRAVDLASLVTLNGFSRREKGLLLDACSDVREPMSAAEFARVERLTRLLAHFWSLASAEADAAIVAQYRIEDD